MLSIKKATKFAVANLIIVSTVFSSVTPAIAQSDKSTKDESFAVGNTKNPKNVIFLVGDGMGPSFNTAYRYYKNDPHAKEMTPTAFDSYLKGTNRTYSNDPKQNITDSAAGGTAFSSGHKTYNGAIGVDSNKQKVKTVLERAKEKGKSTGLVSTAELTDATPAAYAAHVTSRDDKNEIAKQFYKDKGYEWNPQPIKSMKHSGSYMTEKMAKGEDPEKVINEGYGFEFSQDDMKKVKKENKKLKRLLKKEKDEKSADVEKQTKALQHAIQKPVNDKSYTGWTSDGHTGEDVNTYAYGPRSESFSGNIENTESAKIIFDIFK